MIFYCPNCQKEYDLAPSSTVTTLQKRVAYKANCPVCGQDMAEFIPPIVPEANNQAVSPSESSDAQGVLDAASQDLEASPRV
jgi:hypothetical protein